MRGEEEGEAERQERQGRENVTFKRVPGGLQAFGGPLEGSEERVNLTFKRRKAHIMGLDSRMYIKP